MSLSIIVAMTEDRVICKDNQLPWHLSDDLKRFKKITMGHPIIMGRKTFESIGKPLPGRQNIVITRDADYKMEGATVVHSLSEALAACEKEGGEPFVIGGASIFKLALPMADKIYLTIIHRRFEGDVYFPKFELNGEFKIVEQSRHPSQGDDDFAYSFITAERSR